ncbi:chromate transporter [Halalkalibacter hemicellulosilyticus]|uniref:Chromate transporter n=1 Tax=Halalkalibacter hemicellulosilyticusJCM 9152 TaxID=1236971 RepID=W4QD02_9BACI|nr:chromate transporter [Halalkalibacter hemicellulosilyticus]GAE29837.1 chromate transporter [Halalkalibacter hemicellulosilyticusJCM 9152]
MIYVELFIAFFIPGIIGYGGGPASIPLIEYEVVHRFEWMTVEQFSEVLALGNALPGPIATKMAGYIGYDVAGVIGATIAVFATVAPSLILMIVLLGFLYKFKDSPKVKKMTALIRPTIAVLLGVMAYRFFESSYDHAGIGQTLFLVVMSFLLLHKWKVHPSLVIVGAIGYGILFLS